MDLNKFYVSLLLKSKNNDPVMNSITGENGIFFIQIISSTESNRKVVNFIENGEKSFFKANDEEHALQIIKILLAPYSKFQPEILTFDKIYPIDFVSCAIENFISDKDVEEAINAFNLKKEME